MLPAARRRIGLALGSGSARGWSHIGVIKTLQAQGYAPDIVCGTSIGPVIDAVRASIALPGLFTHAQYEGHVLVDGGLVNPVPVSLCRAMDADVVIAVDLNWDLIGRRARPDQHADASMSVHASLPPPSGFFSGGGGGVRDTHGTPRTSPQADRSMLGVIATSLNIMQVRITQSRLAGDLADVVIRPRLAGIGAMDFDHAALALEQGEAAARLVMPQIADVVGR